MATTAVVGLLSMTVIIGRIGDTGYGLWVVVGAFTNWFLFLDLGLRGSVGRYIALYAATSQTEQLSKTISTAMAILSAAGAVAVTLTILLAINFDQFVDVPHAHGIDLKNAFPLIVVNIAFFFVSRAFDAVLWGLQRFSHLNLIDSLTSVFRLAFTVILVHADNGLFFLALVSLVANLSSTFAKIYYSFRLQPGMVLGLSYLDKHCAIELASFGVWNLIISLSQLARMSLLPIIIGITVDLASVAIYSVASKLIEIGVRLIGAASGVFTPAFASLYAQGDRDAIHDLVVYGLRLSIGLALFFATGFLVLGDSFYLLWFGPKMHNAYLYLSILTLGVLIPASTQIAESVLVGAARHRALALVYAADALTACTAAMIVGTWRGLTALSLAVACTYFVFYGLVRLPLACRIVGLSIRRCIRDAAIPAIGMNMLPAFVLLAATYSIRPSIWLSFIAHATIFASVAIVCISIGIFGYSTVKAKLSSVMGFVAG